MRTIIVLLLTAISISTYAQSEPIEVADGFKIEIKTSAICEMCKEALEYDLAFEKGVKQAVLNLDDKVLSIVYNEKRTDPDKLRERVTKVGYHADWMPREEEPYKKLPFCCKDGAHDTPIPQLPTKKKDYN